MRAKEKKPIIPLSATKHIIRALLRTVPFLPVPELYDILESIRDSRTSIDTKINKAYESLKGTSELIGELEQILNEETKKLKQLRQETKKYSKLAEIEEEKARVIIKELEYFLGKGKKRERFISCGISIFAGIFVFILGILLRPIIINLLNKFIDIITKE